MNHGPSGSQSRGNGSISTRLRGRVPAASLQQPRGPTEEFAACRQRSSASATGYYILTCSLLSVEGSQPSTLDAIGMVTGRGGYADATHLRDHLLVHDTRILARRRMVGSAVVLLYRPTENRRPVRFKPGMWERERSRLDVGRCRFLAEVIPNAPMRRASWTSSLVSKRRFDCFWKLCCLSS